MIPKLDRRMILTINIVLAIIGVAMDAVSFTMPQSFGRFFIEPPAGRTNPRRG